MTSAPPSPTPTTDEQLLEEFEAERPGRRLHGAPRLVIVLAAGLVISRSSGCFNPISAQPYRPAFLAVALLLTFLVFRARGRPSGAEHPGENPSALDWALGSLRSSRSATPRSTPTRSSAARRRPSRWTS